MTDTPAASPRLNAIGVVVADISAAVAFYTRLGLSFPAEPASEPHVEADLGGGVRLMLDSEASIREFYPGWSSSGTGRLSFAVEVSLPAEVDRCYRELAADGFGEREPWDAPWGQRYATVRDPDGTPVDLYAPLQPPTSRRDGPRGSGPTLRAVIRSVRVTGRTR